MSRRRRGSMQMRQLLLLGALALLGLTSTSSAKSPSSEIWECTFTDSSGHGPATASGPIPAERDFTVEGRYLVVRYAVPMIGSDGRPLLRPDGSMRLTPLTDRYRLLQN